MIWEEGIGGTGRRSMGNSSADRSDIFIAEVETLLGDPTKAKEKLGWTLRQHSKSWLRKWLRQIRKRPEKKLS